jgi:hypothetical protein
MKGVEFMMSELLQSAEEAFFERHFDYGDDTETALSNFDSSLNVYFRSHKECCDYAEYISDGEVVDIPTVTLALQNLIFAYKYAEQFKNVLGANGTVTDITSIETTGKTAELLASEGTALLASAKNPMKILDMEKGKYLLFAAMNA